VTDADVVRRITRRIVWQTTAMFGAAMLLLCLIAAVFVTRTQEISADRTLHQAISDADAVSDPPSGILIYERHDDDVESSPKLGGRPLDPRAFEAVAAGGRPRVGSVDHGDKEYRIRTDRRGKATVQAAYDLTEQKAERTRLFLGLAIAAIVGIVLAALIGRVIARRAIAPLGLAMQRQQRFVADASHELRTPLTQAHTRAQLLLRELDQEQVPAQLRDDAQRLVASTRQLGEIVEEMLMSAQLHVEPRATRPVDLAAVARSAVDGERERAAERDLTIAVRADDGPHVVPGEPTALRRVLNSLLDNAIGHSPDGTTVTVTVTRLPPPNPSIQVAVRDHGIGLAGADPDSLFDRFVRGDHGSGRRYGLGLALVREVVIAHDGEVTARTAEGGGAEFVVTLPAWADTTN
jgi:signal transduction histidine kinase